MALPFLDTNVFLRHLMADHPDHSPRARTYFEKIERGELQARTSETVVFETVYTLQRHYRVDRGQIRASFLPLLELPGIILPGKRRLRRVFDRYVSLNISLADAYHAVLVHSLKLDGIVSFDRDFDRIPGLRRVEP